MAKHSMKVRVGVSKSLYSVDFIHKAALLALISKFFQGFSSSPGIEKGWSRTKIWKKREYKGT